VSTCRNCSTLYTVATIALSIGEDVELCLACRRPACERCAQPYPPRPGARYPTLCGRCERRGKRPRQVATPPLVFSLKAAG